MIAKPGLDLLGGPGGQRIDGQDGVDCLEGFQVGAVAVLITFAPGDTGVEADKGLG
ncbi:hypothetical protein D3C86_2085110 [compost metagenome]